MGVNESLLRVVVLRLNILLILLKSDGRTRRDVKIMEYIGINDTLKVPIADPIEALEGGGRPSNACIIDLGRVGLAEASKIAVGPFRVRSDRRTHRACTVTVYA